MRGVPWKDAIIALLQPDSMYRPWLGAGDARPGDGVLIVLDTDPASVIATIGVVGADGGAVSAIAGCMHRDGDQRGGPALLELGTLTALTGLGLSRDGAEVTVEDADSLMLLTGEGLTAGNETLYLNGHTTLAAARILLRSGGRCAGCDRDLDLRDRHARYHVHIHTVDLDPTAPPTPVAYEIPPPEDASGTEAYGPESIRLLSDYWKPIRTPLDRPAVLCDSCHDRMRSGGFASFLDFRFSLHPRCPSCSARWTMTTTAGFVAVIPEQPWIRHTGCCPDQKWLCGACGHKWGGKYEPGI